MPVLGAVLIIHYIAITTTIIRDSYTMIIMAGETITVMNIGAEDTNTEITTDTEQEILPV